jgi:hypothetical protein
MVAVAVRAKFRRTKVSSGSLSLVLFFLPCSGASPHVPWLSNLVEKSMLHRDLKVTVDLARLQSPFIVAPGNKRRRRPSPLVRGPPPHVIHITITSPASTPCNAPRRKPSHHGEPSSHLFSSVRSRSSGYD